MLQKPPYERGASSAMARTVAGRLQLTLSGVWGELSGAWRTCAGPSSFIHFFGSALGYRARRVIDIGDPQRHRVVRFKSGVELTYRLNRGDVRAIAETWMTGGYELPFSIQADNIIDLGANIGSTSVWLARTFGARQIVAVEPDPNNAALARINLRQNGIAGTVIEAAVGSGGGTVHFSISENSTLGRIGSTGIEVPLVTPQSLIDRFPDGERIGLLKMDIEGAEADLFAADLGWLAGVDCVVSEIHTDAVDLDDVLTKLENNGFRNVAIADRNLYLGPTDAMVLSVRES